MIDRVVPWRKEWQEKYLRESLPDTSSGQVFPETVQRHSDRIALMEGDERLTYRELGEKVRNPACGLMALGFKPTDRVLFHMTTLCRSSLPTGPATWQVRWI